MQLCAGLFVNIIDDEFCKQHDFSKTLNYPVLAIETVDYDEGSDTEFLLSNPKGEFHWISMTKVRRASQANRGHVVSNGRVKPLRRHVVES